MGEGRAGAAGGCSVTIAQCSICGLIIDAPASPILGASKNADDFKSLISAFAAHASIEHPVKLAPALALSQLTAHVLLTDLIVCSSESYAKQRAEAIAALRTVLEKFFQPPPQSDTTESAAPPLA